MFLAKNADNGKKVCQNAKTYHKLHGGLATSYGGPVNLAIL